MSSTLNKSRAHKPLAEGKVRFSSWQNMKFGEERKNGERFKIEIETAKSYDNNDNEIKIPHYYLLLTREDAELLVKELSSTLDRYNYNGEEDGHT